MMTLKSYHRYALPPLMAFAFAFQLHAADEPAKPDQEPAAKPADEEAKEMAKLPEDTLRDPFWPVDYVPPDPEKQEMVDQQRIAPEEWPTLHLKGVSKTPNGHIAFLRGLGMVTEGETLQLRKGPRIYSLLITDIDKNGIKTKRMGSRLIPSKKSGKSSGKTPMKAKAPKKAPMTPPPGGGGGAMAPPPPPGR